MSMHRQDDGPELEKALSDHGLPHDTPSQLADTFRQGWAYRERLIQSDPMAYVKPKPLEWVQEMDDQWLAWAVVDYERYIIRYDTRSTVGDYSLFIRGEWTPYHTHDAAQAAAYEDLCKRVKELF